MARIRSFKPEAPQHRKVGRLSIWARWLWFVLVTQADDEGRLVADSGQLRLTAFGYDTKVSDGRVMVLLEEIQATGLIRLYAADGVPYADFPSWRDHQRIDHPTPSKLPPYQHSANPREDSRALANIPGGSEGKGSEGIGGEAPSALSSEPSVNGHPPTATATPSVQFQLPESVRDALGRCPRLAAIKRLNDPRWWQAQVRANRGVDFAQAVLDAEAWLVTNASHPKKDLVRFLHNWLAEEHRRLNA